MLVNAVVGGWKATLAANTLYHRVGLLRKLLRTLEKFGAPPCADCLAKIRRPQARPTTVTPEQISKLLQHAPTWQRLFITLAWQLALRFSETLAVTPASHSFERQTVTIRTKGDKVRTIPTTPDVETLLAAAGDTTGQETTPYIHLLRGRRLSTRGIRTAWWYLCDRAGVKGIHPHDLRRTTATNLYDTTKDLRAVQHFLGHDSLASTTAYLAPLTEDRLREMHKLLNFHLARNQVIQ
jgi:integrase